MNLVEPRSPTCCIIIVKLFAIVVDCCGYRRHCADVYALSVILCTLCTIPSVLLLAGGLSTRLRTHWLVYRRAMWPRLFNTKPRRTADNPASDEVVLRSSKGRTNAASFGSASARCRKIKQQKQQQQQQQEEENHSEGKQS